MVLVTDPVDDLASLVPVEASRPVLPAPRLSPGALDPDRWGPALGVAMRELLGHGVDMDMGPVALRVALAARALGTPLATVQDASRGAHDSARLLRLLPLVHVALARHPAVQTGLQLLVSLRNPLPAVQLSALLGSTVDAWQLDVLRHGLAYGRDVVKVAALVRAKISEGALTTRQHDRLVEACEALDGLPTLWQTTAVDWWAEKHHQGPLSSHAERLLDEARTAFPSPAWFWARGKSLSVAGHHDAAVGVYKACLERFPHDSYALHYLAFNLERAGLERSAAEAGFRSAVALEPENPWWNARMVSFLIHQGRMVDAETEWEHVLDRLDPDGTRTATDRWLVDHVHYWIAKAWLAAGDPLRAARVLEPVPTEVLSDRATRLVEQIADAAEAESLGTSVYPSSVATGSRWRAPRLASGLQVRRWFPGRVLAAAAGQVLVVYAVPEDPAEDRRVVEARFDADRWQQLSGVSVEETWRAQYLELLETDEGRRIRLNRWASLPAET